VEVWLDEYTPGAHYVTQVAYLRRL